MSDPWIWWDTEQVGLREAVIDYSSYNSQKYPLLTDARIDLRDFGRQLFRTRSKAAAVRIRHSVPAQSVVLIDEQIKDAILNFVDFDEIDLVPASISCSDADIDGYSILFVYNRVECVDYERSDIEELTYYAGRPYIRSAYSFCYKPNCLGMFHIARERDNRTQLIISDQLKCALARIDPHIVFRRPEDISWPRFNKRS